MYVFIIPFSFYHFRNGFVPNSISDFNHMFPFDLTTIYTMSYLLKNNTFYQVIGFMPNITANIYLIDYFSHMCINLTQYFSAYISFNYILKFSFKAPTYLIFSPNARQNHDR